MDCENGITIELLVFYHIFVQDMNKIFDYLTRWLKIKLTARAYYELILGRELEWIEWEDLPSEGRRAWSNEAKLGLENRCIQSLCGKNENGEITNGELVKAQLEEVAKILASGNKMTDYRAGFLAGSINGIELVREGLNSMIYVENRTSEEHINDAV